jgi:alkaline phosphatase
MRNFFLTFKHLIYRVFMLLLLNFPFIFLDSQAVNNDSKVKNVIIMIGDGMGLAQVYAAYTANYGMLNMFQFPVTGLLLTSSADNYITDSAAGATAFSCGKKTKNGYLGMDSTGKSLKSLYEYAFDKKYATGIVVTCAVTHATPAAFFAHMSNRNSTEAIADQLVKSNLEVLMGGGRKYFTNRSDGRNLLPELQKKGYQIVTSIDSIDRVANRVIYFASDTDLPPILKGRKDYLPLATEKSIDILSRNPRGFLLMVEGSQIDWGGHNNDIDYTVTETVDFDKAVGKALQFAKKDKHTLVIVIADHETGGLSLVGGNIKEGKINAKFSTGNHSGIPVIVYAYGPQSALFTGVHQNTEVFDLLMNALDLK